MDELIGKAVNALVANWPLVAIIGWLGWKGFPWALRVHGHEAFTSEKGQEAMHKNLTAYFNNGGGEKVRQIVQSENAMQSAIHKNEINSAIKSHEEVEAAKLQTALDEFRADITDEFDLRSPPPPPRRPRNRPRRTPRRRS